VDDTLGKGEIVIKPLGPSFQELNGGVAVAKVQQSTGQSAFLQVLSLATRSYCKTSYFGFFVILRERSDRRI